MEDQAYNYAVKCHSETNHLYDGKPYEFHLKMVRDAAFRFIHLIPESDRADVLAACWCHDVIEDCRQTYNDVKEATNVSVASLVFALTNEKGKTRKERANSKYYKEIKEKPYASFIKCCDRIANLEYSIFSGSSMANKYQLENKEFIQAIYDEKYEDVFIHLETLGKVTLNSVIEL